MAADRGRKNFPLLEALHRAMGRCLGKAIGRIDGICTAAEPGNALRTNRHRI